MTFLTYLGNTSFRNLPSLTATQNGGIRNFLVDAMQHLGRIDLKIRGKGGWNDHEKEKE